MTDRPSHVKDKHLEYLDALRESGITNMYGTAPYVQRAFRMSADKAHATLICWMQTFTERHPVKQNKVSR